jgi:hypothetical protein
MVMQVRRQDVKTERSKHFRLKRLRALFSVPVVMSFASVDLTEPLRGLIISPALRVAQASSLWTFHLKIIEECMLDW